MRHEPSPTQLIEGALAIARDKLKTRERVLVSMETDTDNIREEVVGLKEAVNTYVAWLEREHGDDTTCSS